MSKRRDSKRGKVVTLETAGEKDRRKVLDFYEAFTPRTPTQAFRKRLGLLIADATTTTAITPHEITAELQLFAVLVASAGKIGPREALAIVLDAEAGNYGAGE